MTRRAVGAVLVVLLLVAAVVTTLVLRRDPPSVAAPSPAPSASPSTTPTATPSTLAGAALSTRPAPAPSRRPGFGCPRTPATTGFEPTRVTVPGVATNAAVTSPPRDANDIPGTPPLSSAGKTMFAWDRSIRPGEARGNVLLNAHTWPDGSAMGNKLLAGLEVGDRLLVAGSRTGLCYQVTRRIEVLASEGYAPYYDTAGPPQVAVLVCSGRRLGPGHWEKRTIWFASPVPAGN